MAGPSGGNTNRANAPKADDTGKIYTATGLPIGEIARLYNDGLQLATATVDSSGKATWTISNAVAVNSFVYWYCKGALSPLTIAVAAIVAIQAVVLPTLSAAPRMAVAMSKLISSYTGPAVRVRRVSDNVQSDITFDTNGFVDVTAARAFAGTPLIPGVLEHISTYDQSGNALNVTSIGAPWLISEKDTYGAAYPDRITIAINSQKYAFVGVSQTAKSLTLPSGLVNPSQNYVAVGVTAPMVSLQNNALWGIGATSGNARDNMFTEKGTGVNFGGTISGTFGGRQPANTYALMPRINAQTFSVASRASGKTVFVEDISATLPAVDAQNLTGGTIGGTTGGAVYATDQDFYGIVFYPSTITDAEVASVRTALASTFQTAKRPNRLIVAGSSTPEGAGVVDGMNYARLLRGRIGPSLDVWNVGNYGTSLVNNRDSAAIWVDPLYDSSRNCIAALDTGSNDVLSFTSGTASTDAATMAAVCKTWMQGRKAVGFKEVAETIRLRSDYTAYQLQVMNAYNDLLRNGKSDIGYDAFYDAYAVPEASDPTNTTYYQQETGVLTYIHGKSARHAADARVLEPIIRSLMQ
jgi:hypothetical protein